MLSIKHWRRWKRWTAITQRIPGVRRGRTFVALLGPAIEEGITGFGNTVQAALRAFDAQYSRALTPLADGA
jgi:hypothetical protein